MKSYSYVMSVKESRCSIEVRGCAKSDKTVSFYAALTPREAFELWHLLGRTNQVRDYQDKAVRKLLYGRKA
jgi:hypothetical protein